MPRSYGTVGSSVGRPASIGPHEDPQRIIIVLAWVEGLDRTRADASHRPPILWIDDQAAFEPFLPVVPDIGSVARRAILERLQAEGRQLATFGHPSAVVSPSAVLEPGCVIFPGVVIGAHARIGSGTVANRGTLVGHHTVIGPHSFLGPGANMAGCVTPGRAGPCGAGGDGSGPIDRRRSSRDRGGAVAVKNLPPDVTVVGVAARSMPPRGEPT